MLSDRGEYSTTETEMAITVMQKGQLVRRTKRMPLKRAQSFATVLARNPRGFAQDVSVIVEGESGRVEFGLRDSQNLVAAEQSKRAERAIIVRAYRWRRIGYRAWNCRKPNGEMYSVALADPGQTRRRDEINPGCDCRDRMIAVGVKCKHYLCAEEAERRYQREKARRLLKASS